MRRLHTAGAAVLCVAVLVAMAGCGGSNRIGPIDRSGVGVLTTSDRLNADGSRSDITRFVASRDGFVRLEMERFGVNPMDDPFIIVWQGNAVEPAPADIIATDDDSGVGVDAFIEFFADRRQVYTVMWTSFDPGDLGTYRWSIVELVGVTSAATAADTDGDAAKPEVAVEGKTAQ